MPDKRCFKEEDGSEKKPFQWGCKLDVLCLSPCGHSGYDLNDLLWFSSFP